MKSEDDVLDLKGQAVFVSGAGQGAGRAIALTLARHNAGGVAVNDFVAERAEAVANEIKALGVNAVAAPADVGDLDAVTSAMSAAQESLGPLTLLVNNAGNAGPSSTMGFSPEFWQTEPEDWDRYFRTNLYGVMNCCRAALPGMVEQNRGRIVSIISDAGRVGEARLAAYSAAKAGVAGFMRAIARETGRYGITANSISLSTLEPALDEDDMAKFMADERTRSQLSRYAIRRFGQPEDVANMALFLCSDAAEWITGQTYPVNGGYSFTQ
ncbi:MAG: NAD(P)-dependent dehydrogenase (short-subunit alcohol dehydrogenase family) [Halieaceae bacterium]|jgi:NAD(P)-dependent dehydrogenase (short-subunit alcohol dehydrogenase family)